MTAFPYTGQGAVVTGGGSGIGRGLALALARAGMDVAVADINLPDAEETAKLVASLGQRSWAFRCDVTDRQSVGELAAHAQEALGAVTVLCNNAGVVTLKPITALVDADWKWVLGIDLLGVVHGMDAFIPGMIAAGRPAHILNTASVAGLIPTAARNTTPYIAAKYGVVGLSEAARMELEPYRIGVSLLCPGGVQTRLMETAKRRSAVADATVTVVNPGEARPGNPQALSPDKVAERAIAGIRDNQLYIFTHLDYRYDVELRFRGILSAFEWLEGQNGASASSANA